MEDLEQVAIERLKAASEMSLQHYGQPLIITDSGGKDSSVVKELALRSGIPFEIMHNHTTADAPETVRFVRQEAKRFEELGIKYTINIAAFDRMLEERKKRERKTMQWPTGADVFNWWMEYDVLPGQVDLFEEDDYE